jgi:tetratricopeptide (TPR) repeat protein
MPNTLTNQLCSLIHAMTKAEKRHFKLYAGRSGKLTGLRFVHVFDVLEKQKTYNEDLLLKKVSGLRKSQLSNVKKHLYDQLLISLRMLEHQDPEIQIREQVDFARILYKKGLYLQSLKILERARLDAGVKNNHTLLLEILEYEKLIELRHITRSLGNRANELTRQCEDARIRVERTGRLSDLALNMYGFFLEHGPARNPEDFKNVTTYFKQHLPDFPVSELGFAELIFYYQSHVWYYLIVQDFIQCYRNAHAWVGLFEKYPAFLKLDPDLYMKGLHNELTSLFYCGDLNRFKSALKTLGNFIKRNEKVFSENSKITAFLYYETNMINAFFMEGNFTEGARYAPKLEARIIHFSEQSDTHRILIFWYKIACLYFGSSDYKRCIRFLNKIIETNTPQLREDLHVFARLLNLISHYELGNDDLLEYQLRSTYRFLLKVKDLGSVHQAILHFLKKSGSLDRKNMAHSFLDLKTQLQELSNEAFHKRASMYLDIISWLESKIEGKSVQEIIRRKVKKKLRPEN